MTTYPVWVLTKPIPKRDKKVEELKLQRGYEISTLRIRAEQRRLHTEVWTQSAVKSGDDYRSEEKAAICAIPPDIFFGQTKSTPL